MSKIQKLTKGIIAHKNGVTKKIEVDLYDLGFYIKTYIDGQLQDMTTRNTLKKVDTLINKEKQRLLSKNWTVEDIGHILVRRDDKTLKFY